MDKVHLRAKAEPGEAWRLGPVWDGVVAAAAPAPGEARAAAPGEAAAAAFAAGEAATAGATVALTEAAAAARVFPLFWLAPPPMRGRRTLVPSARASAALFDFWGRV